MKEITILRVNKRDSDQRLVWKVDRCDADPEAVGEVTACGVPARAERLPEGTTFTTIFATPDEKKPFEVSLS